MNPELLRLHFDRISDAPDAIPRLRGFILDLAVLGKLVEQDPNEEPASVDSGRSGTERQSHDTQPHGIPDSWRLLNLRSISDQITDGEHATPQRIQEQQVPLVTAKNVRDGFMDFSNTDWVSLETATKAWGRCHPSVGDILLVCVGATTGRLCVLRDARDMVLVRSVALIRPTSIINVDYLALALRSPMAQSQIWKKVKVSAQPCLYINRINSLLIPVPPIFEQSRIVAKVKELMGLCDQVETAQHEREIRRDRLVLASHYNLNNSANAEAFRRYANFNINHLSAVTTRPEHIKQLRQTILNLAVRGQVVPQDPADEPAPELFKRIQTERAKLAKEGKSRRQEPLPLSRFDEPPFELPKQWMWFRLADAGLTQTGTTPPSNNVEYFGDYIPFIRPADLTGTITNYSGNGLSTQGVEYSRLIAKNSVLMVCIGSSIGKVNLTDRNVCCNQQINTLTPYLESTSRFMSFAMKADYFQKLVLANAGMGTLPIISKGKWEILPVPLPPLAEQQRIVARVDELIVLCDRLETQLTTAQAESRQLLEAVLHQSLAEAS